MEKKEEKKFYRIERLASNEQISNYAEVYRCEGKEGMNTQFEVNTRTSSCGSLQLLNMGTSSYKQTGFGLNKLQRQELFEEICNKYEDFNHIFFIDVTDGLLEKFFSDLGFTKVWDYGNTNTWNIVNVWCYNKLTKEEVEELEEKEDDEEYYDGDDDGYNEDW